MKLLKNNKVASYLLYAIGEIFLVMIGILLALQVNNWNEHRNTKKLLNNTLRTISNDLVTDTTTAGGIIAFYEENKKNSLKIINREITMDNYQTCQKCVGLITLYQPFNIQTKGYEQLKYVTNDYNEQIDSLVADIVTVYTQFIPLIDDNNNTMESEVLQNFNAFKTHPWFVDFSQGKFNNEMIEYFVLSEDYRTRVAAHNILAAGNHLHITKQFKLNAVELIDRIHKRLEALN